MGEMTAQGAAAAGTEIANDEGMGVGVTGLHVLGGGEERSDKGLGAPVGPFAVARADVEGGVGRQAEAATELALVRLAGGAGAEVGSAGENVAKVQGHGGVGARGGEGALEKDGQEGESGLHACVLMESGGRRR